ncbi:PBSX family phage terminase large subunit [Bacillus velezensis]|uniref:PBSX family phage terminase large subunit n=1 Tax=Bacillus TaxID=1386 RepID=UPI001C530778|nr:MULTISPECIES: PBSX family phage terminase large subunit [Bacillus amyloliquefaciens group]QXP99140.1 PBSX family phage terminase large subunit [Bacillus velezensis]UHH05007.1 PBSX family phage terminase large subunit [Bacillus amyloliquefaciens]ULR24741.1 PBSX family phage terminase large subunit [Bacillus velezensis]UVW11529.1 PBSX family phage terminase large subunit [Bacillus velezensis]WHL78857.1 PBSX family phage terminase large subunit [Bacillus velezensis]
MELNKKQKEVWDSFIKEQPKILICSGAKRAGKTFVLLLTFLAHVSKYQNMGLSFIIGGATQAAIKRNVLNDMELILGKELRLDKSNAVEIFGNRVYCFDGATADSWKKARGFTSAGAFLNEATALHDSFVKEVISRCSYKGAVVMMDTNPENPMHTVKTDYIDKDGQMLKSGRLNIRSFHFSLFDNNFLDPEYVESIVASTPSGMFTDRDIHGYWVAPEGVIYKDFNKDIHYISLEELENRRVNFKKYFAGVDWGYEHPGSIVVIGQDDQGYFYLLEEHAKRHEEIDYWVKVAKGVKERYGNINFYCDSARPEHVQRFRREKLRALNADKAIVSGIEEVARLLKRNELFIVKDKVELFKKEIFMYVWNPKTGDPVKEWDDVLDALRYALYSHNKPKRRKGVS